MFDLSISLLYVNIIIIFFVMTKNLFNKWIMPNTIFTLLWSVSGFFSMYNNLELIKPSFKVHIYIIITIFIYNTVYILGMKNKYKTASFQFIVKKKGEINYIRLYIIAIIAIILIFPNLLKAVQIIWSSGFKMDLIRREVYVEISNSGSHIVAFLTKNIPQAIFTVISLISAANVVKKDYSTLPLGIISIVIPTITFGGRHAIFNFVIFYVASFLILRENNKFKFKKIYAVFGTIVLVIMTYLRGLNGLSFFDMIIMYFAGSFSYLELIIRNPVSFGLEDPLLLGYLTLGFIFEPIILVLKFFVGIDFKIPGYYFNIYMQPFQNIAENGMKLFNNNSTMIYTFLRDFGVAGVVIGPFFLSWLTYKTQRRYEKTQDTIWFLLLIYMYSVILNSTMSYSLTSISSSLVILVIFIIIKKE